MDQFVASIAAAAGGLLAALLSWALARAWRRERTLKGSLKALESALQTKEADLEATHETLRVANASVQAKDRELEAKDAALRAKDAEVQEKDAQLQDRDAELEAKEAELQVRSAELSRYKPIENISAEVARQRAMLEAEAISASESIAAARRKFEADVVFRRQELETEQLQLGERLQSLRHEVVQAEAQLADLTLQIDLEETGFYQPQFDFEDSLQLADALDLVREAQKELIRQKKVLDFAGSAPTEVMRLGKLGVDAFNGEATTIISGVTYRNFDASKTKLRREFQRINRLLQPTGTQMCTQYFELKIKEMALAFEYRQAEDKARQEQAELKELMREEEDAREEAERARAEAIVKEEQYQRALDEARQGLETTSEEERAEYEDKIRALELQLAEAHARRERATSMAQITRKGHVYVLSNVGSFGDGVFKIGMTRRVEPKERVRELGDASVPFPFDVHALVHCEDAPAVECALHEQLASKRINRVNMRKEFFRASIDDIEEACRQVGCSVRFTKLAEARDYKASVLHAKSADAVVGDPAIPADTGASA